MLQASPELEAMIEAARSAGAGLMRRFGQITARDIRTKNGPADLVSIADEEAERTTRSILAAAQPSFGFLGEEGGVVEGDDPAHTWIVDPLDGTTNFLFGTPLWGVNIALTVAGEVTAGVSFLPVLDELYVAEQGKGAWLNGQPIHVSTRDRLVDSVLGCGIPFAGKPDHPLFARDMAQLTADVAGIRRTGACCVDMAWVACGRWDAYWERALCAWDMAPGVILVREAGGMASSVTGSSLDVRDDNVCVSNGAIHALLLERLNAALEDRHA
ncbi:MAG TPA: inositol monophosphatase family protein [Oleiagrimonas sp.]|nr:inositol monophosphatase family protein [Oleiagrimonas sp.]